MSGDRRPGRALSIAAISFLLLDAGLLIVAGIGLDRVSLVLWGGLCAVGAGAVVLVWRRYLARLAELDRDREELRAELRALGRSVDQARG
jgi:hypothetical protein